MLTSEVCSITCGRYVISILFRYNSFEFIGGVKLHQKRIKAINYRVYREIGIRNGHICLKIFCGVLL